MFIKDDYRSVYWYLAEVMNLAKTLLQITTNKNRADKASNKDSVFLIPTINVHEHCVVDPKELAEKVKGIQVPLYLSRCVSTRTIELV